MTTSIPLTCTWAVHGEGSGRLVVTGDLDYVQADEMNRVLAAGLTDHRGLRHVHLHCSGLGCCDSSGLAALFIAHGAATAAGARLHLDEMRPRLEQILRITGTYEYLTADPDGASREEKLDT